MDLLGSILSSMDKPVGPSEKEKAAIKKQKEHLEKLRIKEKEELSRFRKYTEERISRFVKDDRKSIQFQALDKVYRAIIHEVAEVGGLVAMSFGQEGVDRYTIVYKKEHAPKEDEITARRYGDDWNEEVAKEYAQRREEQKVLADEKELPPQNIVPKSNYKDKYVHLIGQKAALEAARKTESNIAYGFVPSKNKLDQRSIEQTMADIQAKKRLKTQHNIETAAANNIQSPETTDGSSTSNIQ